MRSGYTLGDENEKTQCLRSGGSRISISKMDFEKSSLKVENDQKSWFFGAFWGILRHFELKFAIFCRRTLFVPNTDPNRIERNFLHPQLRGIVYILLCDWYLVKKSRSTSFENFLKDLLRISREAPESSKIGVFFGIPGENKCLPCYRVTGTSYFDKPR